MELKNYKIELANPAVDCSKHVGDVDKLSEAISFIEFWCEKNNKVLSPKGFDHNLMHGASSYWFMTVNVYTDERCDRVAARFTISPNFVKLF